MVQWKHNFFLTPLELNERSLEFGVPFVEVDGGKNKKLGLMGL
jgi:hypothetical protein